MVTAPGFVLRATGWVNIEAAGTLDLGARATVDSAGNITVASGGRLYATDATLSTQGDVLIGASASIFLSPPARAYSGGGSASCTNGGAGSVSGAGGGARGGNGGQGGRCGSALWVWDPSWPELIHPFASAIDTPLPKAPERVHLMLGSAASWVPVPRGKRETHFDEYPADSIEDWHKARGLYQADAP